METVDIYVKQVSGAYVTNTVRGRRTSSTCSADVAARKQAEKLYGDDLDYIEEVDEGNVYVTRWRAILKAPAHAGVVA